MIDFNGRRSSCIGDPYTLMDSFEKEIEVAYKMRQATRHVVTIYGFDFNPRCGLALIAMELGDDSLEKRIQQLHDMQRAKRRLHRSDANLHKSNDYIPRQDRKNMWTQLVNIVQTLNKYNVVSSSRGDF